MDTPLLPGRPPAHCSCCRRPVPTGRLYGPGLGEKCARRRGLIPPPQRKPDSAPQDGPSLLDWQECPPENDIETGDRDEPSHGLNR